MIVSLLLLACTDYNLTAPGDPVKDPPKEEEEEPEPEPRRDPDIEVTPSAVDFGNVLRDCAGQPVTVTITNRGKGKLKVRDIALSGDAASKFGENGDPVELELDQEYEFQVTFEPTAYVTYEVQLDINSNDPDEPEIDVPVEGTGTSGGIYEESFEQTYIEEPIDVLWVLDNSGSMDESLGRLNDQLDLFIGAFLGLGLDYHIGVVTTDMDTGSQSGKLQGSPAYITNTTPDPVAKFESRAAVGSNGSADERGLDAAKAALTDPLLSNENSGFLRSDSTVSVIVLSDENDASSQTAAKFTSWFEGLRSDPDKTTFNAFVGDRGLGCTGGDIWTGDFIEAMGGDKYIDVADATGGFFASICSDDFSSPVINMARSSAGMKSTFELTETPSDVSRMEVIVDGKVCPSDGIDGYTYNAGDNSITFHGAWFPDANVVIEVSYPVDEGCN
jgi:hypothetical protein